MARRRRRLEANYVAYLKDPTHDNHRGRDALLSVPDGHCGSGTLLGCHVVSWTALLYGLLRVRVYLHGAVMRCVDPPEDRKEYEPST